MENQAKSTKHKAKSGKIDENHIILKKTEGNQ